MMPDDLTDDGFLGERLHLLQPRAGFRSGIDAVLLAASVEANAGQDVLDIGCGVGAAMLCLAARVPRLGLYGLELQPSYAELARRNAERNGIEAEIHIGDLREMPTTLRAQSFDHVIANPPYYRAGHWTPAERDDRAAALGEAVELRDWIDSGVRRLKPGGRLSIIQKASRFHDLLAALDERMGAVELKPVAPRAGRDAELVILRARKGARAAARLAAPLVLHAARTHESDGPDWTQEAESVLRDGGPLVL